MAPLHEKTIGGLPTTTKLFTPKSDLWCHFFEFFEKCDFFIWSIHQRGWKNSQKKQQYSEKFFSEILIIYQYFILMEYLSLIERVPIDE